MTKQCNKPNTVSWHTVPLSLSRIGLRTRWPKHGTELTACHNQQHLQCNHEHRIRIIEERKTVAWSVGSRFLVHHIDGFVRIRRFLIKILNTEYTIGRRQACSGYIIVWLMFLWRWLRSIIHNEKFLTPLCELNIVANPMHRIKTTIFPAGYCIYQLDNAPYNTVRIVRECFEEYSKALRVMPWPPKSPGMNPVKHLRFHLERPLHGASLQFAMCENCITSWWAFCVKYLRIPVRTLLCWSKSSVGGFENQMWFHVISNS